MQTRTSTYISFKKNLSFSKFNFNIFKMPLNFLSAIYNGEITLKEAEIFHRNLEKKT